MSPEPRAAGKPLQVRCPSCSKLTEYSAANPYRPFCSERCQSVDLGAWASERYRVEAPAERGEDAESDTHGADSMKRSPAVGGLQAHAPGRE